MSPVISAGVPDDMAERLDEHTQDGETRSEAIRRHLRTGLDVEEAGNTAPLRASAIWVGTMLFAAAFMSAEPTAGWTGLAIGVLGWTATPSRVRRARSTLKRHYSRLERLYLRFAKGNSEA